MAHIETLGDAGLFLRLLAVHPKGEDFTADASPWSGVRILCRQAQRGGNPLENGADVEGDLCNLNGDRLRRVAEALLTAADVLDGKAPTARRKRAAKEATADTTSPAAQDAAAPAVPA